MCLQAAMQHMTPRYTAGIKLSGIKLSMVPIGQILIGNISHPMGVITFLPLLGGAKSLLPFIVSYHQRAICRLALNEWYCPRALTDATCCALIIQHTMRLLVLMLLLLLLLLLLLMHGMLLLRCKMLLL